MHTLAFRLRSILLAMLLCLGTAAAENSSAPAEEEEMVVTAARLPVLISEAPGSVAVITAEELALATDPGNLAESLSLWTGLPLNAYGYPGCVSSLGLSGASSQQVLVMLDGIPLVNPQNGLASLGLLPAGAIGRAEIVTGPLSALYGEDALGGVINLFTGIERGVSFNLDGGTAGANLGFSYGWEWGGLALGLSDTAGERANSDYRGDWQFLTAGSTWLGWDLRAGFYRYADDKGIPGSIYWPSMTAREEDGERLLYVAADKTMGAAKISFKAYHVAVECAFWDDWSFSLYDAWRTGTETQVNWGLRPELSLVGVGKWERTGVDGNTMGEHEADAVNLAAQLVWRPRKALSLYLGDLWHHHSQYGTGHSPRLSMVYTVRPGLVAKAMYGEAFRAPTFNDLYYADSWSAGNPDLLPEDARTLQCVLEYQYLDRLVAGLSVYRTRAENLIEWLDDGTGFWSPDNHGLVELNGIDLSATWRPGARWRILGGLHHLHARAYNAASGEYDLPLASKVPVSASLAAVHTAGGFETALFARYHGAHGAVGAAAPLDLSLAWRYAENARLRLGATNLLDEEYFLVDGYPMPGRTLRLEWRVEF